MTDLISLVQSLSFFISIVGLIVFSIKGHLTLTLGFGIWILFCLFDYHLKNISNVILKLVKEKK